MLHTKVRNEQGLLTTIDRVSPDAVTDYQIITPL